MHRLHSLWLCAIALLANPAQAFEPEVVQVTDQAYAIVGEIGPRTPENHGLNNTLGFVVTSEGVVLIGSGATPLGAQLVEQAVAKTTDQPITRVINIGVQDHHWLGNSYFAAKQIPIQALARTVDNQRQQIGPLLASLERQIGPESHTISPVHADQVIAEDHYAFTYGGVDFELIWPGGGHFTGDSVLWLPASKTLFSGDYIFHDRMLAVHDPFPVAAWQQSFHRLADLAPEHIVPGHGYPGDLAKAKRETGDYLDLLVEEVGASLAEWEGLSDTIDRLADAPAFSHLKFYDDWHTKNIQQTYLQMEANQ